MILKKLIRQSIMSNLLLSYDDQTFKIFFEKGNFDIKLITLNSEKITDDFLAKSSFFNAITVSYIFGSVSKINHFNLTLTVIESNDVMIDFIKKAIPKKMKIKNQISDKQLARILINSVEEYFINCQVSKTIINTFNYNKSKFKFCDFFIEKNNKKIIVKKFNISLLEWFNRISYNVEVVIKYNSILWTQKINIIISLFCK